MSLTLSIVIVSFNTKEKLRKCLSCLDMNRDEIIVVDNASSDGSAEMVKAEFPAAKLVENDQNFGFGKANNIGLDLAVGNLVLLLNSDAYVQANAIEQLMEVFTDESVVATGPMLLNIDGSLQESVAARLTLGKVFLEQTFLDAIARKFGKGYWRTGLVQGTSLSKVDQVMGACLMVRASLGQRFDERFFLYCEDTELCDRLASLGKIVYVREAKVIHELGSSSVDSRWKAVARYNLSKELYFRIHSGSGAANACWIMNRTGAILRLIAGLLLSPFSKSGREKVRIFWRVLLARQDQVIPFEHRSQ